MPEHMLPTVQGEKSERPLPETGDMRYRPWASQPEEEIGQQEDVREEACAQREESQS